MDTRIIVAAAIITIACTATWRATHTHWQARYTALELTIVEAQANGEKAAREALQEAYRRDLEEKDRLIHAAHDTVRSLRDEANTIQAEADRLAREFAEGQRDPNCAAWARAIIACPARLHPTFSPRNDRGSGAGAVHPHPGRTDAILHAILHGTGDKRRPVPAVATTSSGAGDVQ